MSWNEPGGDNKDPWSGRGGDQKGPPDLDEAIRSLQEKLGNLFGGNKGGGSSGGSSGSMFSGDAKKNLGYIGFGIAALWFASGAYIVDEGKQGVETQFGRYTRTTEAGLNWHLPAPIEKVEKVDVQQQRFIEIGSRAAPSAPGQTAVAPRKEDELMLTRDENYVDVQLAVQYQVKDAKAFLFSLKDPRDTLIQVTESALRGVIGGSDMDFVLTEGRSEVVAQAKKEIQEVIDSYNSGIQVTSVNLQDAQAPDQVQHAYEDAIKAREDEQRYINEAKAYANDVVPKARGAAARRIQEAQGYKEQVVAQAEGETSRFTKLLTEYKKAPGVTRQRLYLETMESVLSETSPVMIDVKGGNNMMYLPLDKIVQHKQDEAQARTEEPVSSETVEPAKSSSRSRVIVEDDSRQQISERVTARGRDRDSRGR